MGYIKGLNFKRVITLFSILVLFGNNMIFAQATGATPAKVDWLEVGYYVLLFLLVCLAVAIIGRVLNVYDLSLKMQGKKGIKWNNFNAYICLGFIIVGLGAAYWSITVQGSMTLPESASKHGVDIDNMFLVTSLLTLTVFVITQLLLFVFPFYYKHTEKRKAYYLPHNNTIEKVWTVIPAIALTILVVFGFFIWQEIENSTEVKGDLNVEITGHQFGWYLRYPGKDGKLGNVNYTLVDAQNSIGLDTKDPDAIDDLQADTLVFPVNKPVRLNIRAHDVIHSVYMPHFRLQQNAVPGLPTYFKFIPTITTAQMRIKTDDSKFEYLLYCNKICGGGHYNMQKVVRVVTEEEYLVWIAKQKPFLNTPATTKPEAKAPEVKVAALNKDADKKVLSTRLALNN